MSVSEVLLACLQRLDAELNTANVHGPTGPIAGPQLQQSSDSQAQVNLQTAGLATTQQTAGNPPHHTAQTSTSLPVHQFPVQHHEDAGNGTTPDVSAWEAFKGEHGEWVGLIKMGLVCLSACVVDLLGTCLDGDSWAADLIDQSAHVILRVGQHIARGWAVVQPWLLTFWQLFVTCWWAIIQPVLLWLWQQVCQLYRRHQASGQQQKVRLFLMLVYFAYVCLMGCDHNSLMSWCNSEMYVCCNS